MAKKRSAGKRTIPKKAAPKKAVREKAARKWAPQPTGAGRLLPAPGEIIVRMYRQGLGDCVLLALATADPDDPRYILVDCGVHRRQVEGTKRLMQVMRHIEGAVGGRLHVVIATHEHADHLSGFVQKGSPFLQGELEVDQLWVGWTERVGDPQADRLRENRGIAREILEAAIKKASGPNRAALRASIEHHSDFERPDPEGFDDKQSDLVLAKIQRLAEQRPEREDILDALTGRGASDGLVGAAAKKKEKHSSNELALGLLAMLAKQESYGEPGAVMTIPGVEHVRAYVLGPPRDEPLLKKDRPSSVRGGQEHAHKETYLSAGAFHDLSLSPALLGEAKMDSQDVFLREIGHPFPLEMRLPIRNRRVQGKHGRFFREHYFDRAQSWRGIEDTWLAVGGELALDLDSDTNNTSLVLAFEIGDPGDGQVLLFPGDAQVGNWLSWRDQTYSAGGRTMTADDLLGRTLVYKVGHHGSHNATLKCDPRDKSGDEEGAPFGLELMDDIIAMIPVDRAAADRMMPTPWRMPHRPLYERLREKARLRVLRSDLQLKPLPESDIDDLRPKDAKWDDVPGKPGLLWRQSKETFTEGAAGPLYYDIRIPLGR